MASTLVPTISASTRSGALTGWSAPMLPHRSPNSEVPDQHHSFPFDVFTSQVRGVVSSSVQTKSLPSRETAEMKMQLAKARRTRAAVPLCINIGVPRRTTNALSPWSN